MSASPDPLALHFEGLSDEELLDRWQSGTLTEVAQSLAHSEVRKRGLQAAEPSDLLTVFRTYNYLEAQILRGRLEAEGIPASVADGQTNNQLPVTIGGVRVQVPADFGSQAEALAAAFKAGELALPEEGATQEASEAGGPKPLLWSPDLAAVLSWFFFSSVFGALIHAANWQRLGKSDRAFNSLLWAAACVISFLAVALFGATQHRPPTFLLSAAHVLNTLVWYFVSGRTQSKYVMAELKGRYEPRGWFTPLCIAVTIVGALLVLGR